MRIDTGSCKLDANRYVRNDTFLDISIKWIRPAIFLDVKDTGNRYGRQQIFNQSSKTSAWSILSKDKAGKGLGNESGKNMALRVKTAPRKTRRPLLDRSFC